MFSMQRYATKPIHDDDNRLNKKKIYA